MPKAKPKVPKTHKVWMAWDNNHGFNHADWGYRKGDVEGNPTPVRIVPEAEYQRMRRAAKGPA